MEDCAATHVAEGSNQLSIVFVVSSVHTVPIRLSVERACLVRLESHQTLSQAPIYALGVANSQPAQAVPTVNRVLLAKLRTMHEHNACVR